MDRRRVSEVLRLRARGPLACFTRPELRVERVSYEVMTPAGAHGVFRAVLGKPCLDWEVSEVAVLNPVRWHSFRRNEVNSVASVRKEHIVADEDRAQRNTVALRDVDYVMAARFRLNDKVREGDSVAKFEEMFRHRLARGQVFLQPYLGCREFAAEVLDAEGAPPPHERADRPLGLMFYDWDWRDPKKPHPLFFDARLTDGILRVPTRDEVMKREGRL
jgi:CRISPR-associated protein Cas5d